MGCIGVVLVFVSFLFCLPLWFSPAAFCGDCQFLCVVCCWFVLVCIGLLFVLFVGLFVLVLFRCSGVRSNLWWCGLYRCSYWFGLYRFVFGLQCCVCLFCWDWLSGFGVCLRALICSCIALYWFGFVSVGLCCLGLVSCFGLAFLYWLGLCLFAVWLLVQFYLVYVCLYSLYFV